MNTWKKHYASVVLSQNLFSKKMLISNIELLKAAYDDTNEFLRV